ncbi:MAG: hypothetical protein OES09_00065 [Gammaproteobacteria bacterium]|nr:hypothetical protein [Gammaproteobacteria bacterium]
MPLSEDLGVYFDTDDFGTAGTYTAPSASTSSTVNGILGLDWIDVNGTSTYAVTFRCAESDVSGNPRGGSMVVDGTTYSIIDKQRIDDGETVTLVLHE